MIKGSTEMVFHHGDHVLVPYQSNNLRIEAKIMYPEFGGDECTQFLGYWVNPMGQERRPRFVKAEDTVGISTTPLPDYLF